MTILAGWKPEQWQVLLTGGAIPMPPQALFKGLREAMAPIIRASEFERAQKLDEFRKEFDQQMSATQTQGLSVRLLPGSFEGRSLRFGPHKGGLGASLTIPVVWDKDLALPIQRQNPYRWLGLPDRARPAPPRVLPRSLTRKLVEELLIPATAPWGTAVETLCRTAGLPGLSDDYLSRRRSRGDRHQAARVLVPAEMPVAEALDAVCKEYGYLWWEREGCLYFRSNTWMRDSEAEVPEPLLAAWSAAAARGRIGAREMVALGTLTPRQREGLTRMFFWRQYPARGNTSGLMDPTGPSGELLDLVARLNPGQVSLLLGEGLRLPAAAMAEVPILQSNSVRYGGKPIPPGVVWIQTEQEIKRTEQSMPPSWHIHFTLNRSWGPEAQTQFRPAVITQFEVYIPLRESASDRERLGRP